MVERASRDITLSAFNWSSGKINILYGIFAMLPTRKLGLKYKLDFSCCLVLPMYFIYVYTLFYTIVEFCRKCYSKGLPENASND